MIANQFRSIAVFAAASVSFACGTLDPETSGEQAALDACVAFDTFGEELGPYNWAELINEQGQIAGQRFTDSLDLVIFQKEGALVRSFAPHQPLADQNEAGAILFSDGYGRVTIWQDGVTTELGSPALGLYGRSLNDHGDVAGTGGGRPFVWTQRELQLLDLPAGYEFGQAMVINNARQALVTARSARGPLAESHRALFWDNGVLTELEGFDSKAVGMTAVALNESGAIVGYATIPIPPPPPEPNACPPTATYLHRGFLWQGGTFTDLGLHVVPTALNDANEVTGYVYDPGDAPSGVPATTKPFFWSNGQFTRIEVPGEYARSGVLNNQGTVAGVFRDAADGRGVAFAWHAGELIDLRHDNTSAAREPQVYDINDAGQIVGSVGYFYEPDAVHLDVTAVWDVSACR